MSDGLVPSKSTVYVSNLPFALKNNDLHQVFDKYGRIIKVTILKDRATRNSKGVAFILFLNREDAERCVSEINKKEMFGRTLQASIAKDNGRSTEFIRRKNYPDKSSCYECGEEGHLSYNCSKNLLGKREPPPKKVRKRKKKSDFDETGDCESEGSDEEHLGDGECETLSDAISMEHKKNELEEYRWRVANGLYQDKEEQPKKKIKQSNYFSDEEESD